MQLSYICRGHRLVPCRFPGYWFILCEFLWTRLAISVGFPVMCLTPQSQVSYNPSCISSAGLPELSPMFGLVSLNLHPSVTKWRLSANNLDRHESNRRGQPLKAMHPLRWGVLVGAILIDTWKFRLNETSIQFSVKPPFQMSFFQLFPPLPIPQPNPSSFHAHPSQFTQKISPISPSQEDAYVPLRLSFLPSLFRSVDCHMVMEKTFLKTFPTKSSLSLLHHHILSILVYLCFVKCVVYSLFVLEEQMKKSLRRGLWGMEFRVWEKTP